VEAFTNGFTYSLDALGRLTEEALTYGDGADAISAVLRHGYTPDGRQHRLEYPGGVAVTFQYAQGRLQSVHLPGGDTIRWAAYQWQQPTRIEYPGAVRQLDYDPLQRLARLRAQAVGSGSFDAPNGPGRARLALRLRVMSSTCFSTRLSLQKTCRITTVD